jgi:hypothetical protein
MFHPLEARCNENRLMADWASRHLTGLAASKRWT